MNIFENSKDRTLGNKLKWINEPVKWKFEGNNQLVVTAPKETDLFIDPKGESKNLSAPLLYTVLNGDFIISTRVKVEMLDQYDAGCLVVMKNTEEWAKLCYENMEGIPSILSVVTNKISDDAISHGIGVKKPYLRIARSGNCLAFHYSIDAKSWNLVRYFGMACPAEIKVGVAAQSPVGKECRATFDFLEYFQKPIKNLRIVE